MAELEYLELSDRENNNNDNAFRYAIMATIVHDAVAAATLPHLSQLMLPVIGPGRSLSHGLGPACASTRPPLGERERGEAARQRRLATCLISTAARSLGSSSCTSCTPSVAGRRPRMLARLAACSSTKPSNCCGCCTAVDWPFSAVAQVGQKRARVAGRRRIVTKIEAAPVYRSYCGPCLLVGRLPAINLACGVRAGVIIINYSDPPSRRWQRMDCHGLIGGSRGAGRETQRLPLGSGRPRLPRGYALGCRGAVGRPSEGSRGRCGAPAKPKSPASPNLSPWSHEASPTTAPRLTARAPLGPQPRQCSAGDPRASPGASAAF